MSGCYGKYKEASSSKGCSIGTVIGLALPISMIVMGAKYQDDCPAQHYIPIYLIVAGSFSCVLAILRVIGNCMADSDGNKPVCIEVILGFISLFVFAWFIAGNVWIYGLYGKYSHDPAAANFCDNTFYLFAFWVTTVAYILIGVSILLACCVLCCCRK